MKRFWLSRDLNEMWNLPPLFRLLIIHTLIDLFPLVDTGWFFIRHSVWTMLIPTKPEKKNTCEQISILKLSNNFIRIYLNQNISVYLLIIIRDYKFLTLVLPPYWHLHRNKHKHINQWVYKSHPLVNFLLRLPLNEGD